MQKIKIVSLAICLCAVFFSCDSPDYPYYLAKNDLNIALVVDESGSMSGIYMTDAMTASKAVVDELAESDILSIAAFSDIGRILLSAGSVKDKSGIKERIDLLYAGGSTNVSAGLLLGYGEIEKNISSGRVNTCLLICDGDVDSGAMDLVRDAYASGIRTSSVAIGSDANTVMLNSIAEAGHGSVYVVDDSADLTGVFLEEIDGLLSPVDSD